MIVFADTPGPVLIPPDPAELLSSPALPQAPQAIASRNVDPTAAGGTVRSIHVVLPLGLDSAPMPPGAKTSTATIAAPKAKRAA